MEMGTKMILDVEEEDDVLIRAGIDPEKMEYLTRNERVKILTKAGLNPAEFDF